MKNRKGFTLVELLAVIAILAILVIIALPNVINLYTKAQKETFLTEAKKVYSEAEKKFISNSISNKTTKVINSEDNTKLDMTGEKLQYCVLLNNSGKITSMKVSNGKWVASLDNNKTVDELTIDDLDEGNLDDYECSSNTSSDSNVVYCTFDGELAQGVEYTNGAYTYRYMQEGDYYVGWHNIDVDGWGVRLTDKNSTAPITSNVCTYINNKPIVSMAIMFYYSKAKSINLSNFNTSNVINMYYMFRGSEADSLDLSNFDTSRVTNMSGMFAYSKASYLNVSTLNTSKVDDMSNMFANTNAEEIDVSKFDTSNVTNMWELFANTKAKILDVSNFDTSKVTRMDNMFMGASAQKLDLSNFNTSNVDTMAHMFTRTKVTSLDLSSFDTSKVWEMSFMFNDAPNLRTIYVSDKFVTSSLIVTGAMFDGSTKLVGGAGTVYDATKVDETYARIDGGTSSPGYFTKK